MEQLSAATVPVTVATLPAFKLRPWLKPVLWGGRRIASFKGLAPSEEAIGESWELSALSGKESVVAEGPDKGLTLSQLAERYGAALVGAKNTGREFPLLIKFIDARRNLSLQVHPDDAMAAERHGCAGKTEMWYIIDSEPESIIYAGFAHDVDPADYPRLVASGEIIDHVLAHTSSPGDVYFLPAGRIHAVGTGNFLIEVQRPSDVTYRVYDYKRLDADGRERPLHIDEAREALDFSACTDLRPLRPVRVDDGLATLSQCEYFNVKRLTVEGEYDADIQHIDSFISLTCIAGRLRVRTDDTRPVRLRQGETALIGACVRRLRLAGNAIVVTARV